MDYIVDSVKYNPAIEILEERIEGKYLIESEKSRGAHYIVTRSDRKWTCTCEAFKYQEGDCKHINKVKEART